MKSVGSQARPKFDKRVRRVLGRFGVLAALLASASCDSVIGLRDDYYLVMGGSSGEPVAGAPMSFSGSSASGGGRAGAAAGSGAGTSSGGTGSFGGDDAGVGQGGQDAGSGGVPDGPSCEENPITEPRMWVATSWPTDSEFPPSALTDKTSARWSTGKVQAGSEWLQFDFGERVALRRINLQQGTKNANDYPRKYEVIVSDINQNLNGLNATPGAGMYGVTTNIVLPRVMTGRYLLIKQISTSLSWWSSEEIEFDCY